MTPQSLGFPKFFSQFREAQTEAISHTLESGSRFIAIGAPTGVGKSGIALALAKLLPGRTVVLTANLGLQEQYQKTFESMGLLDVRGRANYSCWDGGDCAEGILLDCKDRDGCPYICAFKASQAGELVESSYAFWLASSEKGTGMRLPETLILDEAGLAGDWLSRALDFHITERECKESGCTFSSVPNEDQDLWLVLAGRLLIHAQTQYDHLRATRQSTTNEIKRQRIARDIKHAESFLDRVGRLSKLDDGWVITRDDDAKHGRQWKFECVWPGRYRERLFRGVQRVVLLSATMRPKTLALLGIGKADYDFREWGRQFPAVNGPVIHIPTARVTWRMSDEDEKKWLNRIDEIIALNLDRKGLVHTVSYARAKKIIEQSKHRKRMIFNDNEPNSPRASEIFKRFAKMGPGHILVSPSFSTGWDFAGELAEYQIICKLPFPDTRSKVMQARQEQDKSYSTYLTGQELVQACGRIVRSADDRGTTYIIDDQIEWFVRTAAEHLPRWFKVRKEMEVPKPLVKLGRAA